MVDPRISGTFEGFGTAPQPLYARGDRLACTRREQTDHSSASAEQAQQGTVQLNSDSTFMVQSLNDKQMEEICLKTARGFELRSSIYPL